MAALLGYVNRRRGLKAVTVSRWEIIITEHRQILRRCNQPAKCEHLTLGPRKNEVLRVGSGIYRGI